MLPAGMQDNGSNMPDQQPHHATRCKRLQLGHIAATEMNANFDLAD